MARLASMEKAGRFCIPPEITEVVGTLAHSEHGGYLLDPCCAFGVALARLGEMFNCKTLGNELGTTAAEEAAKICGSVTCGPIEFLGVNAVTGKKVVKPGDDGYIGAVDVLYLNPPYDVNIEGKRTELDFLKMATPWVRPGGLLVFVVPEHTLGKPDGYGLNEMVEYLHQRYSNIKVRRFPDPHYDAFKQVVLFGVKRGSIVCYVWDEIDKFHNGLRLYPQDLQANEFCYRVADATGAMPVLDSAVPDYETMLEIAAEQEPFGTEAWGLMTSTGNSSEMFRPVMPPLPGHAAMMVMAGAINGVQVHTADGRDLVLRGSYIKKLGEPETVTETMDDGRTRTREERRDRVISIINSLDMATGNIESQSSEDGEEFESFLMEHQDALISVIGDRYPPLFVPERDMPAYTDTLAKIHGPGALPGRPLNGMLPRQAECAVALAKLFDESKAGILVGECGVGKTLIATATHAIMKTRKIAVMAPGQTCQKWAREAESVLREHGLRAHVIGKKRKQAHIEPTQMGYGYTNGTNPKTGKPKALDLPQPSGKMTKTVLGEWQDCGEGVMVAKVEQTGKFTQLRWPGAKMATVSKPIRDVRHAMSEDCPSLLAFSFETAKMGNKWEPACAIKTRKVKFVVEEEVESRDRYGYSRVETIETVMNEKREVACCPDCGVMLQEENGKPWPLPADNADFWGAKKHQCPQCKAALWQETGYSFGGKAAVAGFLNSHYARRFGLIIDEAHNAKSATTDLGAASMDLISASAKPVIAMTGTIYDGKASGIAALLYRMCPEFREQYEWDNLGKFVQDHGLFKEIKTRTEKSRSTGHYGYNRDDENVRSAEIPGVTPGIVAWLLRMSVFIRKEHMEMDLPTYEEIRVPVAISEDMKEGHTKITNSHADACISARQGKMGPLSEWLYLSTGWYNYLEEDSIEVANVPSGRGWPNVRSPKEEAIISQIVGSLAEGRGVGVFFAQWNRRPWARRLQDELAKAGIYSEILEQNTCKKDNREAWYREFVNRSRSKGQEPVLLLSGDLSYEGLDFIEMPDLIETGIDFRLARILQRDQRAHRLTQGRACRVFFYFYENTFEEPALSIIAAKARAAKKVDGKLIEGLAELGAEDDLMAALIKAAHKSAEAKGYKATDWGNMKLVSTKAAEEPKPRVEPTIEPPRVRARPVAVEGIVQLSMF